MKSGETGHLQRLAEQAEATHNVAFSNSVAIAILALKKRYPELKFEETLTSLREQPHQDQWNQAVEFIISRANEPVDVLDKVTLYTASTHALGYESKGYVFPLSEVLALVWHALNDASVYTHHYEGNADAKLQQAKDDTPARIQSFFRVLQYIQTGICHHGIRNELILCLNKIHPDVEVIEDAEAAVIQFIKTRLNALFLNAYKARPSEKPSSRQALTCALKQWIINSDTHPLFALFTNEEEKLNQDIHEYFNRHGIFPHPHLLKFSNLELKEYIEAVKCQLDFDCDAQNYPELHAIQQILNAPTEGSHFYQTALFKIQSLIEQEKFDISDARLMHFYPHFLMRKQLEGYQQILLQTQTLSKSEIEACIHQCEHYFERFCKDTYTLSDINKAQIDSLAQAVSSVKKEKLFSWIEQFFIHWFQGSSAVKANQYGMLLDEKVKKIIRMQDTDLPSEISQMLSYAFNRTLLSAIITPPQTWSERFAAHLEKTLAHLKTRTPCHVYPQALIQQMQFLLAQYQQSQIPAPSSPTFIRPDGMILLPEMARNLEEWKQIAARLGIESEAYKKSLTQFQAPLLEIFMRDYTHGLTHVIPRDRIPLFLTHLSHKTGFSAQLINSAQQLFMCNSANDQLKVCQLFYLLKTLRGDEERFKVNFTRLLATLLFMPKQTAMALALLYQLNPALLTSDNLLRMCYHPKQPSLIIELCFKLNQLNPALMNQKGFESIIHKTQETEALIDNLNHYPHFANQALYEALLWQTSRHSTLELLLALDTLKTLNQTLISVENLVLIEQFEGSPTWLMSVCAQLKAFSAELLAQENFERIALDADSMQTFIRNLWPYRAHLCAQTFQLCLNNPEHAIEIAAGLSRLNTINPALVNAETAKRLATCPEKIKKIAATFHDLHHLDARLATHENFEALLEETTFPEKIILILMARPFLDACVFYPFFTQHEVLADSLAQALDTFYRADAQWISLSLAERLAKTAYLAPEIARLCKRLHGLNPKLLTEARLNAIFKAPNAHHEVICALSLYPILSNENDYEILLEHPKNAKEIASLLAELHAFQLSFYPQLEQLRPLFKNPEPVKWVLLACKKLHEVNPTLVTLPLILSMYDAPHHAQAIARTFTQYPFLATFEFYEFFKQHIQSAVYHFMASALASLYEVSPSLVTLEQAKLLANTNALWIAEAYIELHQIAPHLLTPDRLKTISQDHNAAKLVNHALEKLPQCATPAFYALFLKHHQDVYFYSDALVSLSALNASLLNLENVEKLLAKPKNAPFILQLCEQLHQINPEYLTQPNFDLILKKTGHLDMCISSLYSLHIQSPDLATLDTFNLLISNPHKAKSIAMTLCTLHQTNPALLNAHTMHLLNENDYPPIYGSCQSIYEINPSLLTQTRLDKIIKHAPEAKITVACFYSLCKEGVQVALEAVLDSLMENAAYANRITASLIQLHQFNPDLVTQQAFRQIVEAASCEKRLKKVVETLEVQNAQPPCIVHGFFSKAVSGRLPVAEQSHTFHK